ncbi:MAG: EpsG family protein [Cellulophaga sp.]
MIYFIILFLLLFFAFIYDFGNANVGKNFVSFSILIGLICLSGFRYRVGGDTLNYMYKFPSMPMLSELRDYEFGTDHLQPLWLLLVATAKSISDEFYMLQLIHAIIVNTLIFSFLRSNTKYFFTTILLYYIGYYPYFNFEILRESIAISIFLFSIKFIISKNWYLYFSLSFIAFLFHFSAIILFFIPTILKLNLKPWSFILIFFSGILFSDLFSGFINSINSASSLISSMKEYVEYKATIWGVASLFILNVLYPSLLYRLSASVLKIKSNLYRLFNTYILVGASTTYLYIFFRFTNYLTPILFIFLTEIIHAFFRARLFRSIRMIPVIIIFILFIVIHTNRYFSDTSKIVPSSRWYSRWYPYYSIFDKQEDTTRERLILNSGG